MLATKKELKEQYFKGWLKDVAAYNPSAFDAIVLVEWDDEQVFGYYQYEDQQKVFFLRKWEYRNDEENSMYFRLNGKKYDANDFLRIQFR